ncbi:MAG: penicillin-binding protein [Saprospiraceae bacterium]
MDFKNEVLYRVYFLLFGLVAPAALVLVYYSVKIGIVEGEEWRKLGRNNYIVEREVEAERGNILASDGSLLATSVPVFNLYWDPLTPSQEDFLANVDSLAHCFANYIDQAYTVGAAYDYLFQLRDTINFKKNRNVLLKAGVSYADKKRIEQFPLFNLGQFRGGLIARKKSERKQPFGILARRTIGHTRAEAQDIGLEDFFDDVLGGKPGSQMMIPIDRKRDLWMPLENLSSIEPQNGDDIVTTLDVNIQDLTEEALLRGMQNHDPDWGVAIVMEVQTGKVKAMANLARGERGWYESYNNAIAAATEPGSTFKAASMLALLEDGFINLDKDSVNIENGKTMFYDREMSDSYANSASLDTIPVRQAFEISSNVGIAKQIQKYYGTAEKRNGNKGPAKFIERLKQFNLHLATGITLEGEGIPFIKEANNADDDWSGTTLPWMATGYELEITPLQLLTFYNAIANNGQQMKPLLVTEIQRYGQTVETFKPTVVKRQIASPKSIKQIRSLLEGVVERGTAAKLKTDRYAFAGKTGTAQIDYRRSEDRQRIGGYQASFVGYFPAENPKFSCIVVVRRPRRNGFYGGDVAGPIFREIADKCFDSLLELHGPINESKSPSAWTANKLPHMDIGRKEDMNTVMGFLGIKHYGSPQTPFVIAMHESDSLMFEMRTMSSDKIPNVVGMGLKDALFQLENIGVKVKVNGLGKVVRQSLIPGTDPKNQTITLTLD